MGMRGPSKKRSAVHEYTGVVPNRRRRLSLAKSSWGRNVRMVKCGSYVDTMRVEERHKSCSVPEQLYNSPNSPDSRLYTETETPAFGISPSAGWLKLLFYRYV